MKTDIFTRLPSERLKVKNNWKCLRLDGRTMLESILKYISVRTCTECIWIRKGTIFGLLWTWQWTFWSHNTRGNVSNSQRDYCVFRSSSSSSSCSWTVRHVILLLDCQDEVGPSISSSVVLCFFFLLVYILVLILVVCLCPSFVNVVATFPGTVLFPLLCLSKLFLAQNYEAYSISKFS